MCDAATLAALWEYRDDLDVKLNAAMLCPIGGRWCGSNYRRFR
jgi:hypothetical protein